MRKKLVFGIFLVLILLLLMPNIPAIQQNTINDEKSNEFQKILNLRIKELIDTGELNGIKHPWLYKLFLTFRFAQMVRAFIVFSIMIITCYDHDGLVFGLERPKLEEIFISRIGWFIYKTHLWSTFWLTISAKYGWNWELPWY